MSMKTLRGLGIAFLCAQTVGAFAWWCSLLIWPASRGWFMARGAPDAVLLAFAIPDAFLFLGAAAASAFGLWSHRSWAWPLLCVHSGAAGYAALYCWCLVVLTNGDGWLGAVLMSPSLIVLPTLVWGLRP